MWVIADIGKFFQEHSLRAIEFAVVSVVAWFVYRQFRHDREARSYFMVGVGLLIAGVFSQWLNLSIIRWIVGYAGLFFVVSLIVAYQPELRRAIGEISSRGFGFLSENKIIFIEELEKAVRQLSATRCGALIAIERRVDLKSHGETGVLLDARFTPELVMTIFHPRTALHDGGMIVDDGRIHSASCLFPLTQRELSDRSLGLRHRAGIGISEASDAIAVVVSEETGHISVCHNGRIERFLEPAELRLRVAELLEVDADDLPESSETDDPEEEIAAASSAQTRRLKEV